MSAVLEVPISDLTYTLVRPMITEVVRQMLDATGVDPHTEIRYYGADAGAPQLGSQIDKSEEPKVMSTNRFPHKGHVKIEVEEQPNVNMMGMSGRGGATMPDFFTDSNLGVSVRATRGAYKADIRISFRSPDNNAASMWADLFRSKVEQIRGSLAHAVDFNYVIPESVIERLNAVHECREKVAGYGEEFVDYLVKHIDGRIKFLTTQAGTEPVATVVEREGNIIGVFDVQAVPERASRMDEPNLWNSLHVEDTDDVAFSLDDGGNRLGTGLCGQELDPAVDVLDEVVHELLAVASHLFTAFVHGIETLDHRLRNDVVEIDCVRE
jgi:hypothetical protein